MAGDLCKVTVNLTPKSFAALHDAAQLNEETRTNVINRSIQLYELLCREQAEGKEILLREPDGSMMRLHCL